MGRGLGDRSMGWTGKQKKSLRMAIAQEKGSAWAWSTSDRQTICPTNPVAPTKTMSSVGAMVRTRIFLFNVYQRAGGAVGSPGQGSILAKWSRRSP